MRKADLVDAIVAATAGAATASGTGATSRARKIRSTQAARADDLAVARRRAERARRSPPRRRRRRHGADPAPPAHGATDGNGTTGVDADARRPSHVRDERRPPHRRPDERDASTGPTERTARRAELGADVGRRRRAPTATTTASGNRDGGAGGSGATTTAAGNRRRRRRRGRDRERERPRARARAERRGEPRDDDYTGELIDIEGLLDLRDEGYGFLRTSGLPRRPQRRVRLRVAGAPLRPAQGRLREGRDPPAREQREVPGARARRPDQRHDARRGAQPRALRRPHAAVPRLAAAPRARRRPGRDHRPHHRPDLADRQGSARADRVAAEGGQDHDHQADRVLDRAQQPRDAT